MKMRLVLIFALLTFAFSASAADNQAIRWKPVCRHKAIYWSIMVAEQYPTRIKYGYFLDRYGKKHYHVQPQLFMGDQWWYFKVENDKRVVIITKPTFKIIYSKTGEEEDTKWVPVLNFASFAGYVEYLKSLHVKGPK